MSLETIRLALRQRITIFCIGFAFGAAFMASPAIGLMLAFCALFYLLFTAKLGL